VKWTAPDSKEGMEGVREGESSREREKGLGKPGGSDSKLGGPKVQGKIWGVNPHLNLRSRGSSVRRW